MSWILGVVGENINDTVKNKIQSLHHNALFTAGIHGKFFVVAGGNSQTLHSIQNNQTTVLVAGLGLRRTDQSTDILTTGQWEILLQQEKPNIAALNGHFIAIRYRNNILECFSDRVGLRTLYFGHAEFGWIFSTKLSWVSQHSSRTSIDWKIFGSKWLCVQQFTHESPVLTIRKLPPNGSARIEKNELTIDSTPWIFVKPNVATKKNAVDILKSLLDVNERNLNLGMSGGLDSRVLFSLLSSGKKNFTTYAFGRQDNPDVAYARMISEHGDIPFRELSGKFPSAEECWTLMHDYVLQSNLAEGAATSVRLRHYPELRNAHSLMIDGGNGEIARRQFLQRLLISARNDIFHLRANRLYGHLLLHRADIFNDDVVSLMNKHAQGELDLSLRSLPLPSEIGVENFLDTWVVTTRIPVVACDEQARIDEHVLNFMPYSQPDFIQCVLNLPLEYRRNNRLYKKIIDEHFPSLSQFNLVKSYMTYPYRLSTIQSRIWTKVKSAFGREYQEPTMILFLDAIKEFVCDTVNSASTKFYSPYNYKKIFHAVNMYYKGDVRFANEVNWWIAFDVWRRAVEK